jgi:hypothetical protein
MGTVRVRLLPEASYGRSSEDERCRAKAEDAGSSPAGHTSQARGVSGSTVSSNLAGPGSSPGGPASAHFVRPLRAGVRRFSVERPEDAREVASSSLARPIFDAR